MFKYQMTSIDQRYDRKVGQTRHVGANVCEKKKGEKEHDE